MTPSDHACLALQVCLRAPGQGKTIPPVLQVISRGATTSIFFSFHLYPFPIKMGTVNLSDRFYQSKLTRVAGN